WAQPSEGGRSITSYNLYSADHYADLEDARISQATVTHPSGSPVHDANLGNNRERCYRLEAVNDAGAGPRSNIVCAWTMAPPAMPTNFRAVGGDKRVVLTWDAISGITYTLRAQGPNPPSQEVGAQITAGTITHSGLNYDET